MPGGLAIRGKAKETQAEDVFPEGIKIWHEPGADIQDLVDIVFIHGFTGDRERTWTHSQVEVPWPKRLLPSFIPNVRLLTYGYDAYVFRGTASVSSNRIRDHANHLLSQLAHHRRLDQTRPLIFVVHSLGGLVCKDALLVSRSNPQAHLKSIHESCIAIAFMGTPHSGSAFADWAKIPAPALGLFATMNKDLLSLLGTSSEVLSRLHEDFEAMLGAFSKEGKDFTLTCFYETIPIAKIGLVVRQESAVIARECSIRIDANHRNMCKFRDSDDPGFRSLLGELERWIASTKASPTRTELEKRFLQSLAFVELGERFDSVLTVDDQTCDWIFSHRKYQIWKDAEPTEQSANILWIKGKPGSGKSTVMKKLVSDMNIDWEDVFLISHFFNARGSDLEKSLVGLYRSLLHQILRVSKAAMRQCVSHFQERENNFGKEKLSWREKEVSSLLQTAISNAGNLKLVVVIDALDECEDEEVQRLLSVLEKCAKNAVTRGSFFKMIWSSRHYSQISVRNGLEIRVERENGPAIQNYVRTKFCASQNDELTNKLRTLIIDKASGIFLWCELVVRSLERARRLELNPQLENMQAHIEKLPRKLEDLYENILLRLLQDEDTGDTSDRVLQIALYARRRLDIGHFKDALYLVLEDSTTRVSLKDMREKDSDVFQAYITEITGGLLEFGRATYKADQSTVSTGVIQTIHETVRAFLNSRRFQSIRESIFSGNSTFEADGEAYLARACVRVFETGKNMNTIQNIKSYRQLIDIIYRKTEKRSIERTGLVGYVSHHIFRHLESTNAAALHSRHETIFGTSVTWGELLKGWMLTLNTLSLFSLSFADPFENLANAIFFVRRHHLLMGISEQDRKDVLSCLYNTYLSYLSMSFSNSMDLQNLPLDFDNIPSYFEYFQDIYEYQEVFWVVQDVPEPGFDASRLVAENSSKKMLQYLNTETEGYAFTFRYWAVAPDQSPKDFMIRKWQILETNDELFSQVFHDDPIPDVRVVSFNDFKNPGSVSLLLRDTSKDPRKARNQNIVAPKPKWDIVQLRWSREIRGLAPFQDSES